MNKGLGSGDNGQFTFLDTIALVSFIVGFMNLEENLTQGDKQDLIQELSNKAEDLLNQIHSHLKDQDSKLDTILKLLKGANPNG